MKPGENKSEETLGLGDLDAFLQSVEESRREGGAPLSFESFVQASNKLVPPPADDFIEIDFVAATNLDERYYSLPKERATDFESSLRVLQKANEYCREGVPEVASDLFDRIVDDCRCSRHAFALWDLCVSNHGRAPDTDGLLRELERSSRVLTEAEEVLPAAGEKELCREYRVNADERISLCRVYQASGLDEYLKAKARFLEASREAAKARVLHSDDT